LIYLGALEGHKWSEVVAGGWTGRRTHTVTHSVQQVVHGELTIIAEGNRVP